MAKYKMAERKYDFLVDGQLVEFSSDRMLSRSNSNMEEIKILLKHRKTHPNLSYKGYLELPTVTSHLPAHIRWLKYLVFNNENKYLWIEIDHTCDFTSYYTSD